MTVRHIIDSGSGVRLAIYLNSDQTLYCEVPQLHDIGFIDNFIPLVISSHVVENDKMINWIGRFRCILHNMDEYGHPNTRNLNLIWKKKINFGAEFMW